VTGPERDVLLATTPYLPVPAAATRRCRWHGRGHAASWPRSAWPTCGSRPRRRRRCSSTRHRPTAPGPSPGPVSRTWSP